MIIVRGVNKLEAKYIIDLSFYKQHFIKFQHTEYSKNFINHYNELENMIHVHDKKILNHFIYLNSLELLIEMMKNNMFSLNELSRYLLINVTHL